MDLYSNGISTIILLLILAIKVKDCLAIFSGLSGQQKRNNSGRYFSLSVIVGSGCISSSGSSSGIESRHESIIIGFNNQGGKLKLYDLSTLPDWYNMGIIARGMDAGTINI